MSKRKKISLEDINYTKIDLTNFWEDKRKREEAEALRIKAEREKEEKRVSDIKCPVCKSKNKLPYVERGNNGIYGSGYSSWIVREYLICKECGVHYSDIEKIKNKTV